MKRTRMLVGSLIVAIAIMGCWYQSTGRTSAHCDSMRGPVIAEARAALDKGSVTPLLKWVKKDHEAEVRTAFTKAVAVRSRGPEVKEVADRYFFETLVRLHRAGEGAPYTGLKDEPLDPVVAMADKALADGSADEMIKKISSHMAAAITERFKRVLQARKTKDTSVEAGREFVEAYVTYIHHVEGIHAAIVSTGSHEHGGGLEGAAAVPAQGSARR